MQSPQLKGVDYGGIHVVYQSYNLRHESNREALVFIHGWTCDRSLWYRQEPLFSKYPSILIDLPGHGASEAPSQVEYTQELFARAVKSVIDRERVEKVILIGHSMGGVVSTTFLRLFPDTVLGIVYVDTFLWMSLHYLTQEERHERAQQFKDDNRFQEIIQNFWTDRSPVDLRKEILDVMMKTPKHVRINATGTHLLPPPLSSSHVYDVAALHIVTPRYANIDKHWFHHVPRLELRVWDGHGHFPFLEDADRFNKEVEEFLDKHNLMT